MRLYRLRGRKVCERVLGKGTIWKGKTMLVRYLPGLPRHSAARSSGLYVGTLASARLHSSAVKRNRMRRRCREAFRIVVRELGEPSALSLQLLLIPRSSSLKCPFPEIQEDVRNFLSTITYA